MTRPPAAVVVANLGGRVYVSPQVRDPALAVQVAKLKSDDFGNLVFKEAAKASRGFSLQTLQVESIQPKFLGEMSTIRLHCGKHWAILAEKRLLRGSLEANYLQEPLREKLERLPQSDRDEFKQMAVAAICQEDKERQLQIIATSLAHL